MDDDQEKAFKKEFIERLDKAKDRLRQSFPEIQQLIKTSNVVEVARKITDPAQSIFKQFADDIQRRDLFAKAEALVAKANLTVSKTISRDTPQTETPPNEALANELPSKKASLKKVSLKKVSLKKVSLKKVSLKKVSLKKVSLKKVSSKGVRPQKPLKKKTPSKRKKRPSKQRGKKRS
jgi:hypothetical protein